MRSPAEEYGWTTRSAPARRSLRAAESSDARATMKMSGRAARADRVMKTFFSSESADATRARARGEAGRFEIRVLCAVAVHHESRHLDRGGDRRRVHVDHDVLRGGVLELGRDAAADPAEPADDDVVAQLGDGPSPPSFSEVLSDDTARDQLDDRAGEVEEDCHAREEQDDGEDSRARSFGP